MLRVSLLRVVTAGIDGCRDPRARRTEGLGASPSIPATGERQEADVSRPLDGARQHALVSGAGARQTAGLDLAQLRDVASDAVDFFVVHVFDFVHAAVADSPAAEQPAPPALLAAPVSACAVSACAISAWAVSACAAAAAVSLTASRASEIAGGSGATLSPSRPGIVGRRRLVRALLRRVGGGVTGSHLLDFFG